MALNTPPTGGIETVAASGELSASLVAHPLATIIGITVIGYALYKGLFSGRS